MKKLLLSLFLMFPTMVTAQTGNIAGRVIDASTLNPLLNARVYMENTAHGALTNLDGRYIIVNVASGTYNLIVESLGYGKKTITGIEIISGTTHILDINLETEAVYLDEIIVTADAEQGSTTALLLDRRRGTLVQDIIGSEQISSSTDGDAGEALRRVPGVSLVDGRYAYIRGLGERYSSTLLNGAPLASPEPDKKAIPLNLISSDFLESIATSKSYSPDQPGDFTGGLVQLRTLDFPNNRTFEFGLSTSYNTETTYQRGIGFERSTEFPNLIPTNVRVSTNDFSSEQLQNIGQSFLGDWGPTQRDIPMNFGGSISYGDQYTFDDQRLGFITSFNYSNSNSLRANAIERVFSSSGVRDPEVDYIGTTTDTERSMGGLVSLTYQPRPEHQVKFTSIYNRMVNDVARIYEGFNLDSNTNQWNSRIQVIDQTLFNNQIEAKHVHQGITFNWSGGLTQAYRYEPNTRESLYQQVNGVYLWDDFIQSGSTFHQDLDDNGLNGSLSIKIPMNEHSLSFGLMKSRKERDVYTRRFRYRPQANGVITSVVRELSPNELFNQGSSYIRPDGFQIQEATFRTDNYDANQQLLASYVLFDFVLNQVKVSTGVRMEDETQVVAPKDLWSVGIPAVEGANLNSTDLLPALNVTWLINDEMNLRFGMSRTLARAELRELAPFSFADYAGGSLVIGNPSLRRTTINNFDMRYEWFTGLNTVFSISPFYKRFNGAIETTLLPSSELLKTWVNVETANNYGIELELRADVTETVSLNSNVTLVNSNVITGDTILVYLPGSGETQLAVQPKERPLQGQSPYIVNLGLNWKPSELLSSSLLLNLIGERIDAVGGQATPDIYETGKIDLDFVLEWKPVSNLKTKLSITNILNQNNTFTQGGGLLRQYEVGRTASFGMSWNLF